MKGGGKREGGGFDKRVKDVSDHGSHMEAGRERIKEHLRLALGKGASALEEAGQHRGKVHGRYLGHSLTADRD